jgi:hypothetical protein
MRHELRLVNRPERIFGACQAGNVALSLKDRNVMLDSEVGACLLNQIFFRTAKGSQDTSQQYNDYIGGKSRKKRRRLKVMVEPPRPPSTG